MNRPIGFEQDDEAPAGTGTFHFEDGSKLYAMEPDLAKTVPLVGEKTADVRDALMRRLQSAGPPPGSGDPNAALADAPTPIPGGGAALPPLPNDDSSLPPNMRMRAPVPAPPAPMGPPLPPGGMSQPAPAPAKPPPRPMVYTPGRNPAAEAAAVVPVPTKSTTVLEAEGAPYDPEMAKVREQLNQGVVQAKLAEFEAQKQRGMEEAAAHAAALPGLQQKAAEQRTAFEQLRSVAQKERDRINKYIEDYDQTARVDPSRLYKVGYSIPGIAMVIGQAMGAYAATLAGGDNWAQKEAQQLIEQDVAAQRENIQQGRVGIDNMLARLQQEYGDADQAESAYKILQSEILDREIKSYQAAAGSQAADLAANTWLAQNREYRAREEMKFMDQSIGKRTQTVSADMVLPRQGGARPMTDAELEEAQIKANERGAKLYKSENELQYQRGGGEHAKEGKPDPELYVEGFGNAKTKQEAISLRTAKSEYEARERMLDRMDELNKSGWSAVGIGDLASDEKIEADALSRRFATSIARGYGGPITDSDRKAAELITPDPTSILSGAQSVKIKAAREESRNTLNAQIKEIVSGNHPELPSARKERE